MSTTYSRCGASLFATDVFTSPDNMLERFYDYLDWISENTLKEAKLYGTEGAIAKLDKMRMPTMGGFMFYIGTVKRHVEKYRQKSSQYADVLNFMEESMAAISVEGAAAGLLKETITMRKLGMHEKIDATLTTNVRRVVILHSPDNGRAQIEQPRPAIEDADID